MSSSLMQFLRRTRVHRAAMRPRDAEHDLRKWGFANTLSEDYRAQKRIERLRAKLERLACDDACREEGKCSGYCAGDGDA